AADERFAMRRDDRREAFVRIALMEEDRELELGRERELRLEGALLRVGRREVAKEVEAALADRDDARLLGERSQRVDRVRIELGGMMGMDAGRRIEPGARRRELRGAGARRDARARDDH